MNSLYVCKCDFEPEVEDIPKTSDIRLKNGESEEDDLNVFWYIG